jgi:hypothetical protein
MLCFRLLPIDVGWWPQRLYRGYRWFLWAVPPDATEWLLGHFYVFDPQSNLTVIQLIIVLELCNGIPLFLLCLVVALLVGRSGWARQLTGASPRLTLEQLTRYEGRQGGPSQPASVELRPII